MICNLFNQILNDRLQIIVIFPDILPKKIALSCGTLVESIYRWFSILLSTNLPIEFNF